MAGRFQTSGARGPGPSLFQLALPLLIMIPLLLAFALLLPRLSPAKAIAFGSAIMMFLICLFSTRAALIIIVFSMLLGPEFAVGGLGSASTTAARGVTLRVNDFVLTVVGFSWLAKMALNKQLGFFYKTPLNSMIGWYTVICIVTSAVGTVMERVQVKTTFFYILKYFEYMYVYFMVVNHIREKKDYKLFLWCMLITCAIASIVGIQQIPGGGRITAPFEGEQGEPNTFGGYLMFMVSICGGLLWHAPSWPKRFMYLGIILLAILPLLHTGSRGSYVALLASGGMLIILADKKALALGCAALSIVAMLVLMPDMARNRISFTFEQGRDRTDVEKVMGVKLDTSSSERLKSWKDVTMDFLDHPLLGYGVTGYKFIDGQYFRVIIETGLIGFSFFCLLLWQAWRVTIGTFLWARDPLDKGVVMGFMAGFAGLMVHAISANTFIIGRIMEPFWFMLGMVVMLPRLRDTAKEPEPLNEPTSHA